MTRSATRLVALLALMVLVAAGCRGGGSTNAQGKAGPAGATTSTGAAPGAAGDPGGAGSPGSGATAGGPGGLGGGGPAGSRATAGGGSGDAATGTAAPVGPKRPKGWRSIAQGPLRSRHSPSAVWTGREMIVWGGAWRAGEAAIFLDDGAAYDPATDKWRMLPRSPLEPRADHFAAWTGKEMLIWGGQPGVERLYGNEFDSGAAYDPASDRWRSIARFPLTPRYGARALWTGQLLVVWGGARAEDGADPPKLSDGAAYDPAADRWTKLADSPLAGRISPLASSRGGAAFFSWGLGKGGPEAASATWNPGLGTWSPAAAAPPPNTSWCFDLAGCVGVDTGSRVVFAGEGLAYDPAADRWSTTAKSVFADPFLDGKATAWTGRQVVVWGGGRYETESEAYPSKVTPGGSAYDPAANRWDPLPAGPLVARARARAVWTGAEVIVWGGESAYDQRVQYADGAAFTPS